jgi:hypothetical protein
MALGEERCSARGKRAKRRKRKCASIQTERQESKRKNCCVSLPAPRGSQQRASDQHYFTRDTVVRFGSPNEYWQTSPDSPRRFHKSCSLPAQARERHVEGFIPEWNWFPYTACICGEDEDQFLGTSAPSGTTISFGTTTQKRANWIWPREGGGRAMKGDAFCLIICAWT